MYKDLLENKTVVVVGRAPYLLDNPYMENQAQFIDSHDIVVRINNPMPYMNKWIPQSTNANDTGHFINPEWHDVLGQRTDVRYVKRSTFNAISSSLDVFVKSGGKVVANNRFVSRHYKSISNRISEVCHHHEISRRFFFEYSELCYLVGGLKTTVDTEGNERKKQILATNGHLAIGDILSHNVKQVSMIGFTQYQTDHPQDQEDYLSTKDHPFHCPDHGLLLFRIKAAEDSRLKPDAMLLSLFELKKDMLDQLEGEMNERKKQWYQ